MGHKQRRGFRRGSELPGGNTADAQRQMIQRLRRRLLEAAEAKAAARAGEPSRERPAGESEARLRGLGTACFSCGQEMPTEQCPNSKRRCGHHCNCSWEQDECCWCGERFGEAAEGGEG